MFLKYTFIAEFLEDSIRNRRDLKKSIEIGGEKIILDGDQYEYMNEVNSKGVDFVGFCSMSRVDRETSVVSSKIIQPNDQTTLGSTAIYRTFLGTKMGKFDLKIFFFLPKMFQKMFIIKFEFPTKNSQKNITSHQKCFSDNLNFPPKILYNCKNLWIFSIFFYDFPNFSKKKHFFDHFPWSF